MVAGRFLSLERVAGVAVPPLPAFLFRVPLGLGAQKVAGAGSVSLLYQYYAVHHGYRVPVRLPHALHLAVAHGRLLEVRKTLGALHRLLVPGLLRAPVEIVDKALRVIVQL